MEMIQVRFTVNKEEVLLGVKPYETLLESLRERLYLTGAKEACGLGACGSCTVLLDGWPVRSCLVLTPEVEGAEITTIEGLKEGEKLDPVQEAFMAHGAVQCGFCTPGMVLMAKWLLNRSPRPSEAEVLKVMSSNLCRCTGYAKIIDAVSTAMET